MKISSVIELLKNSNFSFSRVSTAALVSHLQFLANIEYKCHQPPNIMSLFPYNFDGYFVSFYLLFNIPDMEILKRFFANSESYILQLSKVSEKKLIVFFCNFESHLKKFSIAPSILKICKIQARICVPIDTNGEMFFIGRSQGRIQDILMEKF